MSKKENALDLAKFIDKVVRVKLSGGREGEQAHSGVSPDCSYLHLLTLHKLFFISLKSSTGCRQYVD